jgi:PAS domain S-box-containing protein
LTALKRQPAPRRRRRTSRELRDQLNTAEATLEAIRTGEVDALVVSGPKGEQTLAIEGATHPYHALLNAMSDGVVLLSRAGVILFGNSPIGRIAGRPPEQLRGLRFRELVLPNQRSWVDAFVREGPATNAGAEFMVQSAEGPPTPVWMAVSTVPLRRGTDRDSGAGDALVMGVITDLTAKKQGEASHLELMKRLISAEDDERRRIARELHDETGQSLTALLVGLRAIEDQATSEVVKTAAQRLRAVAAATVDNVGRLARGLHPSLLDDLGLAAAVRRHVSDFTKSFGVTVDLRLAAIASRRLTPLMQTTLYRILQEALTNVARHARVGAAEVEFKYHGAMLQLVVRDKGVGFDPDAVLTDTIGLGLHGMKERVALLGGSVEINSAPGRGTSIRARIPPPPPKTGSRAAS